MRTSTPAIIPLTPVQRAFAEANHNVIYSFLYRYHLSMTDWYDVAALGFCKAVARYEPSQETAFTTYAYTVMINDIRQVMRKERNAPKALSMQDLLCADFSIEDTLGYEQVFTPLAKILQAYIKTLSRVKKEVLSLFIEGYTQEEIAGALSCSQAHVSRMFKVIKQDFYAYYEENSL